MFRLVVTLFFFGVCNSFASPTLSEDRIVNGKSASINDFPFQVSIQEDGGHFCGGSIIDRKYVLTAAHCFEGTDLSKVKNMQIRAGSSHWASGGVVKSVKAWHMHPGWDNNTMDNDICILELTSALVPSASIREIPLATVTPYDGTIVTASGWGTTIEGGETYPNLLQKTELAFLTTKACGSQKYGYTKANILDTMVCAVGAATDSCQGDSGGPLVVNDGKLVGVVSWGQGCGRKGYPGVYADVAKFVPWIKETLKKLST